MLFPNLTEPFCTDSWFLPSRAVAGNLAYHETTTKATTVVNQNKSKQHNEPMRTQRKYVQSQARENACEQLPLIGQIL